jgi:hypothetical protein
MRESDPEVIALAASWASLDGKSRKFIEDGDLRDAYLSEALELALHLKNRGYKIIPLQQTEIK